MTPEEASVEINQKIILMVDNEIGDFIKQELINQDFFSPEYVCKLNIKKIAEALEKQTNLQSCKTCMHKYDCSQYIIVNGFEQPLESCSFGEVLHDENKT